MGRTDIESSYRRYIGFLNDRRTSELAEFVHDELSYNGEAMSRIDYQNMIAENVAAIPDLFFEIQLLVVDDDAIACRLHFDCTPQHTFMGLPPNGKRISFVEHVFYKVRDGRIYQVWSLIDRPAVERQLTS